MKYGKFIKYWLPVGLYAMLIYIVTTLPLVVEVEEERAKSYPTATVPTPTSEGEPADKLGKPALTPRKDTFTARLNKQFTQSVFYFKNTVPYFDILANTGLYFWFGILLYFAVAHYSRLDNFEVIYITTVVGFVYSLILEYMQFQLPTRIADANDILANTFGMLLGAIGALGIKLRSTRRLRLMRGLKLTE
jgi:VanZ family protein